MANIISGQIITIGDTLPISGTFKREFVIRALRFNPNDGTPELSEKNTPSIELWGADKCRLLDGFKAGDVVTVSFGVDGRSVTNQDGTTRYFNSIRAYGIERMSIKLPQVKPQQSAQPAPQKGYNPQGSFMPDDRPPFDI